MGANTYRLGVNSTDYYVGLFDAEALKIEPAIRGQRPHVERGAILVPAGELEFQVYLPATNGAVEPRILELARSVLSQIVDMDNQAREFEDVIDSDEILAWIEVRDDVVDLHYYATTVNSEWDARFRQGEGGRWVYRGIPKPGQH